MDTTFYINVFQVQVILGEIAFFWLVFFGAKSTAVRYQFERHEEEQVDSFDLSMYNMHLLYAHERSYTFRIDSLTPEDRWENMMKSEDKLVKVYDPQSRTVMPKRLRDLIANRTPYEARGWCMAEIEWSSTRSHSFQHQKIDRHKDLKESDEKQLKGRVPMSPDDFADKMGKAKFTHRSDSSQVILLQRKVFHQKADKCEKALFQNLPQGELGKLARSLKHYKALKTLEVLRLECSEDEATLFGKAQQLKIRLCKQGFCRFITCFSGSSGVSGEYFHASRVLILGGLFKQDLSRLARLWRSTLLRQRPWRLWESGRARMGISLSRQAGGLVRTTTGIHLSYRFEWVAITKNTNWCLPTFDASFASSFIPRLERCSRRED